MDKRRRKRVLVVDDNRDAADTLAMLLEAEGCDAVASYSGADAFVTAAHLHPDLVIIDLFMPGMGGDQLARLLRSATPGERVVLVAYTAMARHLQEDATLRSDFDCHLVKPASPEELLALASTAPDALRRLPPSAGRRTPHPPAAQR